MLPYTTTWSDFDFGFHKLNQGANTIEPEGWLGLRVF